jgi:hypothetical protein
VTVIKSLKLLAVLYESVPTLPARLRSGSIAQMEGVGLRCRKKQRGRVLAAWATAAGLIL